MSHRVRNRDPALEEGGQRKRHASRGTGSAHGPDDRKVKEWTQPPYVAIVPVAQIQKATLMRATATDEDGKEFTDLKLLKGESRFMSKVEVDPRSTSWSCPSPSTTPRDAS